VFFFGEFLNIYFYLWLKSKQMTDEERIAFIDELQDLHEKNLRLIANHKSTFTMGELIMLSTLIEMMKQYKPKEQ
jgi:hypothetical protein